jgi:AcrR family transcriptional regulator
MRRVQDAALRLFTERGFDRVNIDEIARAADVGVATIYRNFGTKEQLVLWDEYDPLLLEALSKELPENDVGDVVEAARRALSAALSQVYQRDHIRILTRATLTRLTPALEQAATSNLRPFRQAIAEVLARRTRDALEAQVFAGAIVAALQAALDRWLDQAGDDPLGRCIDMAFRRLRRIGEAGAG